MAYDSLQAQHWVDSVFATLTEEQKLGQLMMVSAWSNRDEAHHRHIEQLITKYHIGGLIFFQGGPMRQARLTNRYQAQAKIPLLIAMDLEWGLGMRLDSTINFPRQMALGAIKDNTYIYEMAAEIARQCHALGVHINFAPVVDVNTNPENPVIGNRSFGENKFKVAEKGLAYMRGLQEHGIMATAKHFPGHGDTDTDSHLTLPVINHDTARMNCEELYPFRVLFSQGVQSTMVAHMSIPVYDSTPGQASTLSEPIVTGLLRQKLGYDGLVFTDALNMKGVSAFYKSGEMCVLALKAGNDVLLYPESVPAAVRKIKRALKRGVLKKAAIDKKVRKILHAKYRAGLHQYQRINTDNLLLRLNNPEAKLLRRQLHRQALTLVRNQGQAIPYQHLDTTHFASLSINAHATTQFQQVLGRYAPFAHHQIAPTTFDADGNPIQGFSNYDSLLNKLKVYERVVVGIHGISSRPANNFGLRDEQLQLIKALAQHTEVAVVVFGNAYALRNFSTVPVLLCAYHDNDDTQQLAPQILFGALAAQGVLPVSASPELPEGTTLTNQTLGRLRYSLPEEAGIDSRTLRHIERIAQEAIREQATPGCQVLVAKQGQVVYYKGFGHLSYDSLQPVTTETVYDLASITKVAATLQATMFLAGRGILDVGKRASYYLPSMVGTNKEQLVVRDVLGHQAGLIPFIPFWASTVHDDTLDTLFYSSIANGNYQRQISPGIYSQASLKDSLWHWSLASPLRKRRNPAQPFGYRYSDLSFYIAHRINDKLLNQPMEDFLEQNVYAPLGLSRMTYLPLCKYPIQYIAPTELDMYFRQWQICGTVHDPGAAMYGGVAGHAGLFSHANDLAILFQMNLQDGLYAGQRYLPAGAVQDFTAKLPGDTRRGMGWDKPNLAGGGPTSQYATAATFGHTGFTGTCVWADPTFDVIYIFLSNRIYPDANNVKLIKNNIRSRIQDTIYEAIWQYQAVHN